MEYLKQETMRFADDIDNNEIGKIRSGLKSFYGELPPKEAALFNSLFRSDIGSDSIIRFISFNYTSILDKCIARVAEEPLNSWTAPNNYRRSFRVDPNIIHVHGLLNRYPVFGVNDESQIANKELLTIPDFAQLMIKPKCINSLGELWHSESEKVIQNSNIICVFGMSMGITDTKWFQRIMNWLKASDDRHLIIFWHTDNPSNGFSPWTVFKNKREARNRITDFSDLTSMAIEAISSRIHVIENTET